LPGGVQAKTTGEAFLNLLLAGGALPSGRKRAGKRNRDFVRRRSEPVQFGGTDAGVFDF
jgi:hypothetical protein